MKSAPLVCSAAMEPPQLEGAAGLWVEAVRRFRNFTDIFPPLGLGFGAGIGLGCGFGWNLRTAYGPPRAFCGLGVGFGFAGGYGHGPLGRRFGKDNRSEEAIERIRKLETAIDSATKSFIIRIKSIFGSHSQPSTAGLPAGHPTPTLGFVPPPCTTPCSVAFALPLSQPNTRSCAVSQLAH